MEISLDNACMSVVTPLIAKMWGKMQSTSVNRGLLQMQDALNDAIKSTFCIRIGSASVPLVLATTHLDPLFKQAYLSNHETAVAATELIDFQ
jgi:hypothetical protein